MTHPCDNYSFVSVRVTLPHLRGLLEIDVGHRTWPATKHAAKEKRAGYSTSLQELYNTIQEVYYTLL